MSKQSELNSYITRVQQRLRLGVWLRGAAIFTGTALLVTLVLVFTLNHFAFPLRGLAPARMALISALLAAAAFGIALPLKRLTRARAVRIAESANPELEERLTTFAERESTNDPFLELLAADTLTFTQSQGPSSIVADNRLFALSGAALACLGVLIWMVAAAPGYVGYGASLLWTGPPKGTAPFYAIDVAPGNTAVRRNSDQLVTARVRGMHPEKVELFAHYQSATGWEPVAMQAMADSGGSAAFQFVFAGLPETVDYYVAAGPLVSSHYKVRVVDLPKVKGISVTYHFPRWTGMKPLTQEHTGDLRAIEGTDADLELETDHPLKDGHLMLDGGQIVSLTETGGNRYKGSIRMDKDGAYHIAATDEGQQVRLSEDYFIATDKAMPPQVAISRPGGDYRASPIEEVSIGVNATDQFGLNDVRLHYSVNGGPDREVSVLKAPGAKNADGTQTLPLEDFKLVPGDVVSLYASARDGHSESRTDISFIQVDPFEREFSQSQQAGGDAGGGGAGQNNQTEISKREKELIAATWKQQNDKTPTAKEAAAAGLFLADAQQKLHDQVMALDARIQSRDLSEATEEFTGFDKDMQAAAAAMTPSADKLRATQWKDAISLEQKALQALLRAEATFRQIQVAFGQRGGGGGGGGNAGRDLASLFDLELDTEKNQYETAQKASPADQRAKDVEDALEKLDALAKRQEDLANQQHDPQQSFQERWQQEMLRREAEQLQRQMEQLAKNGQPGQSGSNSSSDSRSAKPDSQERSSSKDESQARGSSPLSRRQTNGQPSTSPSSGQSHDPGDQRIEQALNRLQQAGDAMKRSTGPQQSPESGRQAADRLREASNLLSGTQQQLAGAKLDSLTHEAGRLRAEERSQSEQINKLAEQQTNSSPTDLTGTMTRLHERDRLAQERQQLSDDLSRLQKNLRDSAREMASNQPGTAKNLRDALTEMDDSDLDNHMQRTADWLRRGINPNSNGTESQIAQGLEKLSQQLQQAQQGMGSRDPQAHGANHGDSASAAVDAAERLRSQIEAMAGSRAHSGEGRPKDQTGRTGQQPGAQQGGAVPGANKDSQGNQQPGGNSASTAVNAPGETAGSDLHRGGDVSGRHGDVRRGGGPASDGTVWGNINTGDNRYGQPAPRGSAGEDADSQRSFQQGVRELNQLRQIVKTDPGASKEAEELAAQMRNLDPRRFPGNPAIVEQMHQEVLSSIDRLELLVERNHTAAQPRSGKPLAVPAGYQDPVANYYQQLSKNP